MPPPLPSKNRPKKMAAKCCTLYFMFLAPPPNFLDPLLVQHKMYAENFFFKAFGRHMSFLGKLFFKATCPF